MALPADYTTVPVSGRYVHLDGTPVRGAVKFRGKVFAASASSKTVVVPFAIVAELDAEGRFTVDLPATDDPDVSPGGWTYTVTEVFSTGHGRTFELDVPVAAAETGIDLSEVAPATPQDGDPTAFVTVSAFAEVAKFLDPDGKSIRIRSSYAGGEDDGQPGHFDSTGRLNLESYQRASFHSYGEVIRIYSRRADSKQMIAWYGPTSYDMQTREPVGPDKPWFWMGAHYEANDHQSIHGHWSCEVPDSTGALQTRLEMLIWDPNTGQFGMDKTVIKTNQADFNVRTTNGQEFRLSAPAGVEKPITFSLDSNGGAAFRRWKIRCTDQPETGGNAGSDLQISRYADDGSFIDSPIHLSRSTGKVTLNGTDIVRAGGTCLQLFQNASSGGGVTALHPDTSGRAFGAQLTSDSQLRFVTYADGRHEWGPGNAARDTNLYRSAADTLRTDDSLQVGATLHHQGVRLGFFGATPVTRPVLTYSRSGETEAQAQLRTALAQLGLVEDNTTE